LGGERRKEEWICPDLVPAYTMVSMLSITIAVIAEVKETESNICLVCVVYTLTVMSKLLVMHLRTRGAWRYQ
jgi:hypothetical protein